MVNYIIKKKIEILFYKFFDYIKNYQLPCKTLQSISKLNNDISCISIYEWRI